MYQQKIAYGKKGFPWTISKREVPYEKGICPVAEELNDTKYFGIEMCLYEYSSNEIDFMIEAFHKVWKHLDEL